jgi:hypothetical protein
VAVGVAATGLVTSALIGGATAYRYYDTLADPLQPEAVAGAVALTALMAASAGMVRWLR